MRNQIGNVVAVLVSVIFLLPGSLAWAEGSAKQTSQPAKPAKVVKAKKATGTKQPVADKDSCEMDGKRWASGASCMTTCNEKKTICDMRICKQGEWKNFGSCFGNGAVSPNCPAACGS